MRETADDKQGNTHSRSDDGYGQGLYDDDEGTLAEGAGDEGESEDADDDDTSN